jgi:hypothetical protein
MISRKVLQKKIYQQVLGYVCIFCGRPLMEVPKKKAEFHIEAADARFPTLH